MKYAACFSYVNVLVKGLMMCHIQHRRKQILNYQCLILFSVRVNNNEWFVATMVFHFITIKSVYIYIYILFGNVLVTCTYVYTRCKHKPYVNNTWSKILKILVVI
jgi:hypothetical protein